jgi:hypothetical protein
MALLCWQRGSHLTVTRRRSLTSHGHLSWRVSSKSRRCLSLSKTTTQRDFLSRPTQGSSLLSKIMGRRPSTRTWVRIHFYPLRIKTQTFHLWHQAI